jgi:hypothetical protein
MAGHLAATFAYAATPVSPRNLSDTGNQLSGQKVYCCADGGLSLMAIFAFVVYAAPEKEATGKLCQR